jgi:disulfide bond formation protein DsbB
LFSPSSTSLYSRAILRIHTKRQPSSQANSSNWFDTMQCPDFLSLFGLLLMAVGLVHGQYPQIGHTNASTSSKCSRRGHFSAFSLPGARETSQFPCFNGSCSRPPAVSRTETREHRPVMREASGWRNARSVWLSGWTLTNCLTTASVTFKTRTRTTTLVFPVVTTINGTTTTVPAITFTETITEVYTS